MNKALVLALLFLAGYASESLGQEFLVPITVSDGTSSTILTLGVHPDGTDDFDQGLDVFAPPAPPSPSFDARLDPNGLGLWSDVRSAAGMVHTYEVSYRAEQGSITLSWDAAMLAGKGTFMLTDRFGGDQFSVDMTQTNTFDAASEPTAADGVVIRAMPGGDASCAMPPAAWDFTANTGGNATVIVPEAIGPMLADRPLQACDAVAVFFERDGQHVSAGYAIWQDGQNMAITAWGDNDQTAEKDGFAAGETLRFRLWDAQAEREYDAEATYAVGDGTFQVNGIFELASLAALTSATQECALGQGWNMLSSYIAPEDPALEDVFSATDGLVIAKNNAGQVYIPAFSINAIGDWDWRHGYQVFTQQQSSVSFTGAPVDPATHGIDLAQGWNLPSYLPTQPMGVETALASISDVLVIAKNNAGQVYIPAFAINAIGQMQPCEGYQMFTTAAATLTYPAGPGKATTPSSLSYASASSSPHAAGIASRTGSSAVLVVEVPGLSPGDEVGVRTASGRLVGAAVVADGVQGRRAVVTAWGDDPHTAEAVEGAVPDEALYLVTWRGAAEVPLPAARVTDVLTSSPTHLHYTRDGLLQVWAAPDEAVDAPAAFTLAQNYPNPFNPMTMIRFGLASSAEVTLAVYDVLGRRVAVLLSGEQRAAGWHEVVFEAGTLPSGVYYYRLEAGAHTQSRAMNLLR